MKKLNEYEILFCFEAFVKARRIDNIFSFGTTDFTWNRERRIPRRWSIMTTREFHSEIDYYGPVSGYIPRGGKRATTVTVNLK